MNKIVGPSLILLCTVIWGAAFLAQKLGADHYGPFAMTCYRNILGGAFLAGVIAIRDWRKAGCSAAGSAKGVWKGGALSGVVLFLAMVTQQIGIEHTTPGISAFLTANYVLLVPLFAWAVGRGRPGLGVWAGVALALIGTSLICFSDFASAASAFRLGRGEAFTLLCAALFAVQIMVVDRFARGVDVVKFSMVQLFVAAGCALPFVFLPSEIARASVADFVKGLPALCFVGILSSGVAYTLQNLGQARTPPALAAIIMSLEGVFGTLFGWLILHDVLTPRQFVGCALVFVAVIASQLIPTGRGAKPPREDENMV